MRLVKWFSYNKKDHTCRSRQRIWELGRNSSFSIVSFDLAEIFTLWKTYFYFILAKYFYILIFTFDLWDTIAIIKKKGTSNVGEPSTFNWLNNTEALAPPLAVILGQTTSQPCRESVQVEENIDPFSHRARCVQDTLIGYSGLGEPVFSP